MKFYSSVKVSQPSQLTVVFKDDLESLVNSTECPNSKMILSNGMFKAKSGELLPLIHGERKVFLLGLGEYKDFEMSQLHIPVSKAFAMLKQLEVANLSLDINLFVNKFSDKQKAVENIVRQVVSESYVFEELKSKKSEYILEELEVVVDESVDADEMIKVGANIALGQNYTKDLQNLPANICNTNYMLNEARELTNKYEKFNLSYLTQEQMADLGMSCALAVGRGSDMPSYTVCMEYNGAGKDQAPIVIVGKGLVFDSGGLSIKPALGMGTMKMDMGGAASVMGTMQALAELDLPINVVGVMGLAENAVDARSYRPGDVLKTMKGISVEVSNTDAEGRLVLCDTLTYVEKYKPAAVIDIATLTGAMIIALGDDITGMFSNSDSLANDLEQASAGSEDLCWKMPLFKPYMRKLKSDVADMDNCGDRSGASITAALFLSRFTEDYEWAHLDVAGSAMGDFVKCKATGRPVPMLMHYLLSKV